mgnify:CR=1 FL=1
MALVPTAPPLHVDLRAVLEGTGDLMSLEPPKWAADSSSVNCQACSKPFSFLVRSRHHCRVCGDLFCDACSSGAVLAWVVARLPCVTGAWPYKWIYHATRACCMAFIHLEN